MSENLEIDLKPLATDAGEQAVQLAPTDVDIQDSRGLAYALAGQVGNAIVDFQAFADQTNEPEQRDQRLKWIEALKAGQDPNTIFTEAVLEALMGS